jgi:hypothetical protein
VEVGERTYEVQAEVAAEELVLLVTWHATCRTDRIEVRRDVRGDLVTDTEVRIPGALYDCSGPVERGRVVLLFSSDERQQTETVRGLLDSVQAPLAGSQIRDGAGYFAIHGFVAGYAAALGRQPTVLFFPNGDNGEFSNLGRIELPDAVAYEGPIPPGASIAGSIALERMTAEERAALRRAAAVRAEVEQERRVREAVRRVRIGARDPRNGTDSRYSVPSCNLARTVWRVFVNAGALRVQVIEGDGANAVGAVISVPQANAAWRMALRAGIVGPTSEARIAVATHIFCSNAAARRAMISYDTDGDGRGDEGMNVDEYVAR